MTHRKKFLCFVTLALLLALEGVLLCHTTTDRASTTTNSDDGVTNRRGHLSKDSRAELAAARARGETSVTLVIAAKEGLNPTVAKAVTNVVGTVEYRNDEISYLRARIPTEKADEVADNDAIESVSVDVSSLTLRALTGSRTYRNNVSFQTPSNDVDAFDLPSKNLTQGNRLLDGPSKTEWSDYPFTHPYSPLKDLGAAEMLRNHRTFDGRGVTIAHVELGIDLLVPEFESALSLDGRSAPKVVDVNYAVAQDHHHDADLFAIATPWTKMETEIVISDGIFTANKRAYKAPHDGNFRFGIFEGRQLCHKLEPQKDVSASAPDRSRGDAINPFDPECRFGVLWDEKTNEVWLDTNRDNSFLDETPLTNYAVRHDIGIIGRDNPETTNRESFSFTVQIDQTNKAVAINLGDAGHGTSVAASAAGSKGSHGRIPGVAPGAQLLEISWGFECVAGMIEALIKAFSDQRTDIVLFEQSADLATPYRLGDGRFTATVVTSRLVTKYKKPFVIPASNYPMVNASAELGNVPWGFSVGAFESKDSYLINRGILMRHDDNLHIVGAWGPNGVGAIKPDIVVPSGYLTAGIPNALSGVKGLYRLPPGYKISGGTSQGAPTMAGALALLISAAKQEHVPFDAQRIWLAVTNSARYIPNLHAYQQGNGAVDITGALELLKRYAKQPPSITISSRGPVRTAYSDWFDSPNEGVCIWESEEWRTKQHGERTISFIRTSGPPEPMTFNCSWLGNDGSFSSSSSITLPLNQQVPYSVVVSPTSDGVHSALLTLDHPDVVGHAYRVMTTIIASKRLDGTNQFGFVDEGRIERPGPASTYFNVPPGVDALSINLTGGSLATSDPFGFDSYGPASRSRIMSLPRAGTWTALAQVEPNDADDLDIAWQTSPGDFTPRVPYRFDVTLLGVAIDSPSSLTLAEGSAQAIAVSARNKFGSFTGGLAPMAIGAARTTQLQLKSHEQKIFDIQVPEGSPLLTVETMSNSQDRNDIDFYLFDCTGKRCLPVIAVLNQGNLTRLRELNPKAGSWRLVIDASRVPTKGITIDLIDIVADLSLGNVSVADSTRVRKVGDAWTTTANVWLVKKPSSDRYPVALISVNARQGGIEVPIGLAVTPIKTAESK